jgi:hypothetical protein
VKTLPLLAALTAFATTLPAEPAATTTPTLAAKDAPSASAAAAVPSSRLRRGMRMTFMTKGLKA